MPERVRQVLFWALPTSFLTRQSDPAHTQNNYGPNCRAISQHRLRRTLVRSFRWSARPWYNDSFFITQKSRAKEKVARRWV